MLQPIHKAFGLFWFNIVPEIFVIKSIDYIDFNLVFYMDGYIICVGRYLYWIVHLAALCTKVLSSPISHLCIIEIHQLNEQLTYIWTLDFLCSSLNIAIKLFFWKPEIVYYVYRYFPDIIFESFFFFFSDLSLHWVCQEHLWLNLLHSLNYPTWILLLLCRVVYYSIYGVVCITFC